MTTDFVIAGGGIAGMLATLILADTGARVICVDPAPQDTPTDLRSTAFLMPAIRQLQRVGVFDTLQDAATPLRVMRIVEAATGVIAHSADFTATEAGEDQFGWNIPNHALRAKLPQAIAAHPNATLLTGQTVDGHTPRLHDTIVRLSGGEAIKAKLLIAADGRDSRLRDTAGITARRFHYGQKALVFAVRHTQPHDGISTEVHMSGGPFTLVPLAGPDQTRSAVVWMDTGPRIAHLTALDDASFEAQVNTRACGVMGPLQVDGPKAAWPIIAQYAQRLSAPRLALIAEAAHVVPPIGAQGLNMSLADVSALANLATNATDPGDPKLLDRYHKSRWPDLRLRVQGIDALNRASMAQNPVMQSLRDAALKTLSGIAPIRKAAITAGLGR